jgi:hypothetical protein
MSVFRSATSSRVWITPNCDHISLTEPVKSKTAGHLPGRVEFVFAAVTS